MCIDVINSGSSLIDTEWRPFLVTSQLTSWENRPLISITQRTKHTWKILLIKVHIEKTKTFVENIPLESTLYLNIECPEILTLIFF